MVATMLSARWNHVTHIADHTEIALDGKLGHTDDHVARLPEVNSLVSLRSSRSLAFCTSINRQPTL